MIQLHIIRTNDFQQDFEKYIKFDEIFKCLFDDEAIDTAIILQEFSRDFCKIVLEKYNNANSKNKNKKNIRKNKYHFSWSEKNIYKDFLNFDKNYERYPINFFKNIIYVVLKQLQERNALKYGLSWAGGTNEETFKISCNLNEIQWQVTYCQDMIEAYNRMQNLNYLLNYGREYKKIFKN